MIDVDTAAAIVYDSLHKGRYSNTFADANDKGKWRTAIAELLDAMNRESV